MFGVFLFRGENEGDNESVETQDLSENQNEDHAHKKPRLLSCAPHACVAHDANSEACRQPTQAHTKTGSQMEETPENRDEEVLVSMRDVEDDLTIALTKD